jgi:DNA-binding transcriptional MocR family regulator
MRDTGAWRYQKVVRLIRGWIDSGMLKSGERLRSIREMSLQTGYSMITIHHAYSLLESEGVLVARPRSGFFVADVATSAEFPKAPGDFPAKDADEVSVPRRLYKLMASWRSRGIESFGSLHPSRDLLPYAEVGGFMRRAFREQRDDATLALASGDPDLREIIAKRAALRGALVHTEDVIVAGSNKTALELCLDAVTRPGDLVLIESPSYFPLFSSLQRRQLKVMEIYSHPRTGIDPDQFDYLLDSGDVRACLLMPVNHYPTGVTYPESVLGRIVAKASARQVPIIENDAYGELSHGGPHGSTLKAFDPRDFVLQVGSFAPTLGPRYGLGWVVSRRYRDQLLEHQFFNDAIGGDAIIQRAVAQYILRHSYDRHLRRMRQQLEARMRRGLTQIAHSFPAQCAVSRPAGGFTCWVRLVGAFDSLKAADRATQMGLSFLPGPLFSVTSSFRNFIGLNLSFPWNGGREAELGQLAELLVAASDR